MEISHGDSTEELIHNSEIILAARNRSAILLQFVAFSILRKLFSYKSLIACNGVRLILLTSEVSLPELRVSVKNFPKSYGYTTKGT